MTDALQMPKFTFNNLEFQTDEEFQAYDKEQGGGRGFADKYFKPGNHEVTIEQVEVKGLAKNDDTWVSLCLHLKGTGEKMIKGYIQVPTDGVKYGPRKTLFPFKNLQTFCGALGYPLNMSTVKDTVKNLFARPEKLVGKSVLIQVGYQKGYVKYVGKNDDGSKSFNLVDKDNNPVRDVDGTAISFPDTAAAYLYAEENKIAVDKYTSVLTYQKSAAASPSPSPAALDARF